MRVYFAAAACTWGYLACAGVTAHAAEITDLASSFEKDKPFGFKLGATYNFSYKTASINRESVPLLQSTQTAQDINLHYKVPAGQQLGRTETVPDLVYTQRRQQLSIDLAIGIFQDLQLGVSLPLVLRDERQYDLNANAGWNQCPAGSWDCVANSSSTFLDGIYPIQPADQLSSGSTVFRPPVRGGSGMNMLDTINISLMGAPVSQKRDPSKPTWTIGVEGQISIGTIMAYDNTRNYLDRNNTQQQELIMQSTTMDAQGQRGWGGVSEGVHRIIVKTALSHKFKYVDPYFGLYYMLPIARKDDGSPWKPDYSFAQKFSTPQMKAGTTFGFEATPIENKRKGHRLALDFRAGLDFHFLGRGYSEAWELLSSSSALICDDQNALPQPFNYKDPQARPGIGNQITQGTFNPACRQPASTASGDPRALLTNASAYYQQPYTGLTLIENYLTFTAQFAVIAELFHHARLRLAFNYLRDQGHVITQDDAGSINYPQDNRNAANGGRNCNPSRVDLSCPVDWNPAFRQAINVAGRHYRVDDVNVFSGSAMLQAYW